MVLKWLSEATKSTKHKEEIQEKHRQKHGSNEWQENEHLSSIKCHNTEICSVTANQLNRKRLTGQNNCKIESIQEQTMKIYVNCKKNIYINRCQ